MDDRADQQSAGVGEDVSLAAVDLLAGVEAARTTRLAGLDRLAIDHPGRGARLAPGHLARLHQQVVVDQFPPSIVPPLVEIALYGRKRRKVLGEHPPLATRFGSVTKVQQRAIGWSWYAGD